MATPFMDSKDVTSANTTPDVSKATGSLVRHFLSKVSDVITTTLPDRSPVSRMALPSTSVSTSTSTPTATATSHAAPDNDSQIQTPDRASVTDAVTRTLLRLNDTLLGNPVSPSPHKPYTSTSIGVNATTSPSNDSSSSSSSQTPSLLSTMGTSLHRTLKTMASDLGAAATNHNNNTNASMPVPSATNYTSIPAFASPNITTDAAALGGGPSGSVSGPGEVPGYVDVSFFDLTNYNPLDNITGTLCDWGTNSSALCGSNTTNTTTPILDTEHTFRLWAVVLVIFPLLTIFGNTLVVLSVYKERSLRTVTNYFIVSLALADVLVSVLVMPLAVYVEVNMGSWLLGDSLCDAWVAFDVLASTASILNLTAISVDRFIAVTQPIKYAKHKNSNRVYLMLALVWIVSIAIASPIALGMNYSDRRSSTPELCIFYNSDFLIYSSMGSFYIPCIIMIFLYWRIFRAIHLRAKKAAMHKKTKVLQNKTLANVIENTAQTSARSSSSGSQQQQQQQQSRDDNATNENSARELMPAGRSLHAECGAAIAEETTTFTNMNATDANLDISNSHLNTTDQSDEADAIRSPISDDANVIPNDKSTEFMLSPVSEDSPLEFHHEDSGYSAPTTVEVVTTYKNKAVAGSPKRTFGPRLSRRNNHKPKNSTLGARLYRYKSRDESPKKSVTKFNFHLRHSKKKKEKTSSRRERKATKTLAIVLGVFLFCWVPFFTANIMNAICIRYNMFETQPECNIPPELFNFFVWLGYINSFLNPVIYTIFNNDFRRAFKKLLMEPCK